MRGLGESVFQWLPNLASFKMKGTKCSHEGGFPSLTERMPDTSTTSRLSSYEEICMKLDRKFAIFQVILRISTVTGLWDWPKPASEDSNHDPGKLQLTSHTVGQTESAAHEPTMCAKEGSKVLVALQPFSVLCNMLD